MDSDILLPKFKENIFINIYLLVMEKENKFGLSPSWQMKWHHDGAGVYLQVSRPIG